VIFISLMLCTDEICHSFEELLSRSTSLSDRIGFINALSAHTPPDNHEVIQKWCREQQTRAFTLLNGPTTGDIPVLIEAARLRGVSFLVDVLVLLLSLLDFDSLYHY
jgi:hypothetical protein